MRLVPGVPYHSQGQGMIETRFRGIAHALVATLGHKADRDWYMSLHLMRIEMIMNSMHCEPIGGSPHLILFGEEPRTGLAAAADWTKPHFGEGIAELTYEDMQNTVAEDHLRMRSLQDLAMLGSTVAQTLTKMAYDADALPSDFEVGGPVAVHRAATNKLEPHFTGPFVITELRSNGNFAVLRRLFGPPEPETKPVHTSAG